MNCSKCGKDYDDSFRFCPACGESKPQTDTPPRVSAEQTPMASRPMPQPPPPPGDQRPAATRRPKRKGKVIAIVAVSVVVVLGLLVVLGTLLIKGYEAKAKTEAQKFVQNAVKKDYAALYKQIGRSSYPTMWLSLVCSSQKDGQSQTAPPDTGTSLENAYSGDSGILSTMLNGEPLKSSIQNGELSSAKATSISDQTFYVELNYKGATEPFRLIVNRQDNKYSVDFAATLVLNDPSIAKKTRMTVEGLLKDPTAKNLDTAQAILDVAQILKSELGLWLKTGPKHSLNEIQATEINAAIQETEGFAELSSKVEKAREALSGDKGKQETIATELSTPSTTTPKSSPSSTPQSTPKTPEKTEPKPSPAKTSPQRSPEYMCASIQKGHEVANNDPLVSSFAAVFDALQSEYPNDTRESFADKVVTAKQLLDSNSTVSLTLLEVAQGILSSTTPEIAKSVSLNEIAAAYVTILINEYPK